MFNINKIYIKKYSIAFICMTLTLSAISCSNQIRIENINNNQKINVFKISNDNFGEINFKINLNYPIFEKKDSVNNFSIKNNTNGGGVVKTNTDVTNFLVYLIKNASTTGYPAGGDPLSTTDLVSGPFTVANTSDTSIKFTGVKPLASGAYYVAVRAVDNVPNDLIKVNNGSGTAWGTTTAGAPYNGKVAVSSGAGITVNSSTYAVNTINALNVPVNLSDGIGAGITVQTTINQVNTDPFVKPIFYNINTIAGTGTAGATGDGGVATSAQLNVPYGVAVDSSGNVYIADYNNSKIRKITASTGIISTIAGTGTSSATPTLANGDGGLATSATLNFPRGVSIDSSGNVYIADTNNSKIRKITASTGIITTIAGNGAYGFTGDGGVATSAQLNVPYGVSVDLSGNVYIADYNNLKIRKVTAATGIITTIAGTGTAGSTGDGGVATSATLKSPSGLSVDSSGNVYIADSGNNKIRKITASTGIITTIAGTGTAGSTGNGGVATSATLTFPSGVSVDSSGNVYIADLINNKIRKITASTGIITTIAGTGIASATHTLANGDGGLATSATLNYPYGVSVDSSGNVYIADAFNNKIRKLN